MSKTQSYRGRLRINKVDELAVDLRVVGQEVLIVSSGGSLGSWRLSEVEVARLGGDEFLLELGGEEATFFADDVISFSYEGMPVLQASSGPVSKIWGKLRPGSRQHSLGPSTSGERGAKVLLAGSDRLGPRRLTIPLDRFRQDLVEAASRLGRRIRSGLEPPPARRVLPGAAEPVQQSNPVSDKAATDLKNQAAKSITARPARSNKTLIAGAPKPEKVRAIKPEKIRPPKPEKVRAIKPEKIRPPKPEKVRTINPERIRPPKVERIRPPKVERIRPPKPDKPKPETPTRVVPAVIDGADEWPVVRSPASLAPRQRPRTASLTRVVGKAVFASADLALGRWPGPRLLIYHQIGNFAKRQMEVDEETFVTHLDWLQSAGSVLSLEEAIAARRAPDSHRVFAVTFDDGYADLFTTAFPLLEERGLPFALYLSTDHVESGNPMAEGRPPLAWDQIGKMAGSGLMTLGAHTHRHFDLRGASRDQIEEDLALSDELIEERTGIVPRHFAYPFGYWSPVADTVVRRRYDTAALGGGRPVTASTDPYLLHRLPIQRSDGAFFFKRKALRGMRLEESVRRAIKGYRSP